MQTDRRRFSAQQKVQVLRQHLVEKTPSSQVCEQHGIQPTQFYQWQKVFFENGAAAFEKVGNGRKDRSAKKLERKVSTLESKIASKDELIAEIMESHVQLKKSLGQD